MDNLKSTIIDIIAKEIGASPQSIKDDTSIQNDLCADSLNIVNIVMTIEDNFNIEIEEHLLAEFTTVGSLVNRLSTILA